MKDLQYALLIAFSCITLGSSAQWQANGSGHGSIRSITTEGNRIHMVSYLNGIFTSADGGTSWSASNNGLPLTNTSYFVRSVGRNATHLFAGTHSGVFRSADNGATWTSANGTLTATNSVYANKFFLFGNTTFAVFTGTIANGGGMHRTVDNGNTWLIGHSGLGSNATVYHMVASSNALYAATSVGLYRSTDNGQQWALVPGSNFSIYAIQSVNGRLIAITSFGYRYSDNDGATWSDATGAAANPTKGELVAFDNRIVSISGTSTGCYISLDNGATYTTFNDGLAAIDVVAQEQFHVSGQRLYMGTFSDLYILESSSVSVPENNLSINVPSFPNPFVDGFTIDLSALAGGQDLIILDASGREVRRIAGLQPGQQHIPREGLAAGNYTLHLRDRANDVVLSVGHIIAH